MTIEFFFQFGYLGLFIISFLAASLLPLSSEFFVLAMPPLGYNIWLVGIVATVGNFAGALMNYYVGKKGSDFIFARYFQIKQETWDKAESFYRRWGPVALFFSWVPIIGDPLTAVAGALHLDIRVFTFWVIIGKGFRYVVLLGFAEQIYSLF
ncbi:MAG: DedA family protein [Anaerolineales bacterium]|nr:DedA family protein [Anaerolineales bacterium]MCA9928468.1 DedA family protein [Anaerolineales bacterium]